VKRILVAGVFRAIANVDVNAGAILGFAETVAVNRAAPVAVFSSVTDAERWLLDRVSRKT